MDVPMDVPFDLSSPLIDAVLSTLKNKYHRQIKILAAHRLSEDTRRNLLLRLFISDPSGILPKTLILKQPAREDSFVKHHELKTLFAKDWAGLEFLTNIPMDIHIAPLFYGGNLNESFILLEDMGEEHISLVDSLTENSKQTAIDSLKRYMKCLGQFHGHTYGKEAEYNTILSALTPDDPSWEKEQRSFFEENLPKIQEVLNPVIGKLPESAVVEMKEVMDYNLKPGPFRTYLHGDNCPDNVFDDSQKNMLRLIDFEYGHFGQALLDATYLRMGMPTCWCSKAIPDSIIDEMELIYRQELIAYIPQALNDDAYETAYVNACAGWLIMTIFWLLENNLKADEICPSGPVNSKSLWQNSQNLTRPRIISRLQTFITVSSKAKKLLHLRLFSENLLAALNKLWPEAKGLSLYPAFQN